MSPTRNAAGAERARRPATAERAGVEERVRRDELLLEGEAVEKRLEARTRLPPRRDSVHEARAGGASGVAHVREDLSRLVVDHERRRVAHVLVREVRHALAQGP